LHLGFGLAKSEFIGNLNNSHLSSRHHHIQAVKISRDAQREGVANASQIRNNQVKLLALHAVDFSNLGFEKLGMFLELPQ